MFNGTKTNKALAKIQVILGLAMVLLTNSACERKDLFLRVDVINVSVEISDIRLNLLWGVDWQTDWNYTWNESAVNYGTMGYTEPELIKGTIYNVDRNTGKRYSSFFKIFGSNGGRVALSAGSTYDMMFYNFGTEYTSFYQSDDYYTYTASTRVSTQTSWIRTRAQNEFSDMPDTTKSYIDHNQPDELFGTLVTGLSVNEDPTIYKKEYDADGNISYVYRVEAALRPYSFIYMYQIIVINNKDEQGNRVVGANGLTVTGLSQGVEMFSRKTFNNTISISTEDIKPMQHHTDVKLKDGREYDIADILAARILTWGLPGMNPLESTKAGTKAPEIDNNYIGIGLMLRNGYTFTLTRNITEEMHDSPAGGVITIVFDANEIPQEILDRKPKPNNGGFNASVENWANEMNAEMVI